MRGRAATAALLAAGLVAAAAPEAARAEEASGPPWSVEISGELALAPGTVGAARVVLRGRGRHRVSPSGLRLDLKPSGPGISVRQRRYLRADAGGEPGAAAAGEGGEAVFSIPVRGEAVGSYDLEVRARFWVCTPRSCRPVDERRRLAVTVSEPAPPPAPASERAPDPGAPTAAPAAPAAPRRAAPPRKSRAPARAKPAEPSR